MGLPATQCLNKLRRGRGSSFARPRLRHRLDRVKLAFCLLHQLKGSGDRDIREPADH